MFEKGKAVFCLPDPDSGGRVSGAVGEQGGGAFASTYDHVVFVRPCCDVISDE